MKVAFVGPTLFDLAIPGALFPRTGVLCRPPAQQGDILRAVRDGAAAIGLIDGRYEDVAAPWHKEILHALSRGVAVYGAASMGALRAAECAAFGMVPVGAVAQRYLAGDLTDDAAVAQVHAPSELGSMPLTEALVNVEATIRHARARGVLGRDDHDRLLAAAERVFFKDRTYPAVIRDAGFAGDEAAALERDLVAGRRDVKREDALALMAVLEAGTAPPDTRGWTFHETTAWRRFVQTMA